MTESKLYRWFTFLLGSKQVSYDETLWRRISDWDRAAAGDVDQWWDEPHFESLLEIIDLWDSEPVTAYQKYSELADKGSVHAMIWLGHCYNYGHGTRADFENAYTSYGRAISAGSWVATLEIAKLLFKNGFNQEGVDFLEQGIEAEFTPANFWLARHYLKHSWSRKTFRSVRSLLDYAVDEGHPGAEALLAVAMLFGRYGIKDIRKGFTLLNTAIKRREQADAAELEALKSDRKFETST
jgi:TPR repeat protein